MSDTAVKAVREGSRWAYQRPSGEELADWFAKGVPLHPGMKHSDFVAGITLIESTEKLKVTEEGQGGQHVIVERPRIVYTPYPRVDIRIRYFQLWLELHPDLRGFIEPAYGINRAEAERYQNDFLPEGFFRLYIEKSDGLVEFIGCSKQVRIEERESGNTVALHPAGTKICAVLGRYGDDPNCVMKAETGAVGRALAFAGMLVIPGSGVATAEDMMESRGFDEAAPEVPPAPMRGPPRSGRRTDPEPDAELLARLLGLPEADLLRATTFAAERGFKLTTEEGTPGVAHLTEQQQRALARFIEQM